MVNAETGGTVEWMEIWYKHSKQNTIIRGGNIDILIGKS